MDPATFILQQLKQYQGEINVDQARLSVLSMLNTPYFDSGGSSGEVRVVRECYEEFNDLDHYGPAPKLYLAQILRLAHRWDKLGTAHSGTATERALFRYNSALLHSVVIEAIKGTEE